MSMEIDVGETLEENGLAFHHRLRSQRTEIAEPENSGAVGDDRDEIALRRVVVNEPRVFSDGFDGNRDARRIGETEIALRRHRLCRHDFELSRLALGVKLKRFLAREFALRGDSCFPRLGGRRFGYGLEPRPCGGFGRGHRFSSLN